LVSLLLLVPLVLMWLLLLAVLSEIVLRLLIELWLHLVLAVNVIFFILTEILFMLLVFKASIVFTDFFLSTEFVLFAILLFWLHHLPSDSIVSAFVNELTDYNSFKLVVVAFNN
jgi:hypothetical protein